MNSDWKGNGVLRHYRSYVKNASNMQANNQLIFYGADMNNDHKKHCAYASLNIIQIFGRRGGGQFFFILTGQKRAVPISQIYGNT